MDKEKKDPKINIWIILFSVFLVLIAIILCLTLSYERRTDTVTTISSSKKETLVCNSGFIDNAFFGMDSESQAKHQVKILLIEDQISKLFYMYSDKLKDATAAERFTTEMNIKYDKYLAEHKVNSSQALETTFSHPDANVRIDVYTNAEGVNFSTAVFFFLESNILDILMRKNASELKAYYVGKGFSCTINS